MTDPIFREAKNALERLSLDPRAQELAEERRIGAYFYELGLRMEKEKAAAEGHAEGRAEGRAEGERAFLQKVLTLKFGPLSDEARERLQGANEADLTLWLERALSATTLDDVFS